jgi:hypothetical protein
LKYNEGYKSQPRTWPGSCLLYENRPVSEKRTVQKTLRFPESLAKWIEEQAAADQRKFVDWIVVALENLREEQRAQEEQTAAAPRPKSKPRKTRG